MTNNKSKLQHFAMFFAVSSFILSVLSIVYLYFKIDELTWQNPISASLLASSFFFAFVGFILVVIGTANIPSFSVKDSSNN